MARMHCVRGKVVGEVIVKPGRCYRNIGFLSE